MGKNELRGYIVDAILFVVFSVIAFAAPFEMNGVFWLAYIFGVIAILAQVYFFRVSFTKGADARSKFYGFPIAKIGVVYLIAQLVVSLVEMIVAKNLASWIALVFNVIVVALAAIGCISADIMRDEIQRQDQGLKKNVSNMRALQSLSASLAGLCGDELLKSAIQNMAEEFKYSDPVSSEDTLEMEKELDVQLKELQKAIVDGDIESAKALCGKIGIGLAERNRIAKLGK